MPMQGEEKVLDSIEKLSRIRADLECSTDRMPLGGGRDLARKLLEQNEELIRGFQRLYSTMRK